MRLQQHSACNEPWSISAHNPDCATMLQLATIPISACRNTAAGERGGGAILVYNSSLYASNAVFSQNDATAANLYSISSPTPPKTSDDALPELPWCGPVGGVLPQDDIYGLSGTISAGPLASEHLYATAPGTLQSLASMMCLRCSHVAPERWRASGISRNALQGALTQLLGQVEEPSMQPATTT